MSINSQKTKLMFFNKSLKYDAMPEIQVTLGENLEVVEEYKILGIIVSTDMKWNKHVDYICKRGYSQLWTLRRLKKLGASSKILFDIYEKHIRSILEYASPVWSPMLTLENINQLERVQKCVFAIIFGQNKYHKNLSKNGKISLEDHRLAQTSTDYAQNLHIKSQRTKNSLIGSD